MRVLDTFIVDVLYVGPSDDYVAEPSATRVEVQADDSREAELLALQIVAADGRKPVRARVDWDNF